MVALCPLQRISKHPKIVVLSRWFGRETRECGRPLRQLLSTVYRSQEKWVLQYFLEKSQRNIIGVLESKRIF